MPPASTLKQKGLLLFAGLCLVFLFVGGPDIVDSRSFKHTWNLGHVAAFTAWTLLLVRNWPWLAAAPFGQQAIVALLFCIAVGGSMEIGQGLFGRYPAWGDMGRNTVGCLLATFFLFPKRVSMNQRRRRLFQAAALALLLISLIPVARALVDEWAAWRDFPVLADFETPFEMNRWSGNAGLSIDQTVAHSGRASLRMDLNTDTYSGAALHYFPGNWLGWAWISFSVFNPDAEPVRLTCKINDQRHDISGYRYHDRFNRSYVIPEGWNRIRVSLKDVENAPDGRQMDLKQITEFNLFAVRLPFPRTLYLDDLTLETDSMDTSR